VIAYRVARSLLGPVVRAAWGAQPEGEIPLPYGPLVVVSNHDSLADPFFLGTALDRPLRFVAKEELWSNRVVGWLLDGLGGIRVRRGRGDLEALAAAAEALRDGHVVAIFPQGTVLGSDERPWLRGAARLALATGTPLVPVRIVGAERALRPGSRLPRRARVRVVVGEPIGVDPGRTTIVAARELTDRVRRAVDSLV
jgi:1-acyl-sn-glycerol-3-phosphate acyltransferase